MTRTALASLASLALLGFAGCGMVRVRPVLVNPAYAAAKMDGRTIQVLPIRELQVMNQDDLEDDFKDSGSALLAKPERLFSGMMREALAAFADHADPVAIPAYPAPAFRADSVAFRDTLLDIPSKGDPKKNAFRFPKGESLKAAGLEPDLGLQLDHLRFSRYRQPGPVSQWVMEPPGAGGGAPSMHLAAGGNAEALETEGVFILWDYRADAMVACGHFHTFAGLMFGMDKSTWEAAFGAIAREVIRGTPLQGDKLAKYDYDPRKDPLRR